MPQTPLAGLNLVVPVRADFATRGPNAFDNVRGGAELWSKLISTGLRGTNFLLTAGYEAQWFHRLSKVVHMGGSGAAHGLGDAVSGAWLLAVARRGCAALCRDRRGRRSARPVDPDQRVAVGAGRYTTALLGRREAALEPRRPAGAAQGDGRVRRTGGCPPPTTGGRR